MTAAARRHDSGVDDVAFITAMVERLKRALPIDDRRVYAAGMSNGGVLAYALACRTSLFAAIGVVAGTQVGRCEDPRPTSVIHVHGLADIHRPLRRRTCGRSRAPSGPVG